MGCLQGKATEQAFQRVNEKNANYFWEYSGSFM